jgi:hypothetical protein
LKPDGGCDAIAGRGALKWRFAVKPVFVRLQATRLATICLGKRRGEHNGGAEKRSRHTSHY